MEDQPPERWALIRDIHRNVSVESPNRMTDSGEAWVKWVKRPDVNVVGYVAAGGRFLQERKKWPFWAGTVHLVTEVLGLPLDYANAAGQWGVALGALGLTSRSGFAQGLLCECLRHCPEHYLETMMPVLQARSRPLLGATGWSVPDDSLDPDEGMLLVSALSNLLRDDRCDSVQINMASVVLPILVPAASPPPGAIELRCAVSGALLALGSRFPDDAEDVAQNLRGLREPEDAVRDFAAAARGHAFAPTAERILAKAMRMQWLAP